MNYADDYQTARNAAQAKANMIGRDYGLERSGKGYIWRALPDPHNRYGVDLSCEVVTAAKAS